jgi:C_GCAxxG_C_C family probable redox protein
MEEKMTETRANEMMAVGFHCSQVVMCHVAEMMGTDVNYALRLTAGLGAGCNHGDTCGVISAGALALGLLYGFDQPNAAEENTLLIAKVREFQERFVALHGSTLCRVLLNGYDAADPNRQSTPTTWDNCGKYCEDACAILDDMIGADYRK